MATKGISVYTHNGEDYTVNDPNVAEEFSTSKDYYAGDMVNYQGDLYKFIAKHSAGSWNGDHAAKILLGAETEGNADSAGSWKNANSGENVLDFSAFTANKRIRISDGALVSTDSYSVSNYIPVACTQLIRMNFYIDSDSYGGAFYDQNKRLLSTWNKIKMMIVPNGAAYLRATIPNSMLVEGSETAVVTIADPVEDAREKLLKSENIIEYGMVKHGYRLNVSTFEISTAENQDVTGYIPVLPGAFLRFDFYLESGTYGHVFYNRKKEALTGVSGSAVRSASDIIRVPDNAYYVRMTINKTDLVSGSETAKAYLEARKNTILEKTNWLAVGDSITLGVYSYMSGDDAQKAVTKMCWVRRLAAAMDYDLTVMASRGMGYSASVTGQDPLDSSAPRISLDTLLTRIEALTNDFNLITLAFGINDYATSDATIQTMTEGLDDAISRLQAKWPGARLVVITPFNSCREGDAGSNYAYNTEISGRSLKDMADAIRERCEAYGVECVYATNGFVFNNYNIETLEPDNTHPSITGHKLIAKTMAHYLYF